MRKGLAAACAGVTAGWVSAGVTTEAGAEMPPEVATGASWVLSLGAVAQPVRAAAMTNRGAMTRFPVNPTDNSHPRGEAQDGPLIRNMTVLVRGGVFKP